MSTDYQARASLKRMTRAFFDEAGFLEVDTPILVKQPGVEVHMDFFETQWRDFHQKPHSRSLRTSPELHLKILLSQGFEKIYEIAPVFRNGGELTEWHHPEFTMIEWYQTHTGFDEFILQTEAFFLKTQESFCRSANKTKIIQRPLTTLTVGEAFEQFVGIELIDQDPHLAQKGLKQGVLSVNEQDDFETAFFKILLEKIEPKLKKLEFVCLKDFPPSQAILSKIIGQSAKRFEFYIHGIELCNAFLECFDLQENQARLQYANDQRRVLGKPLIQQDEKFYQALQKPIPECCGNALGFDRWLALLQSKVVIDDVISFRNSFP